MNICDCREWKQSMPQIGAAQALAHLHGAPYTGSQFNYCPWCGRNLTPRTPDSPSAVPQYDTGHPDLMFLPRESRTDGGG